MQTSIVIASALRCERAATIKAAIDSVLNQQPQPAIPILVANGPTIDPELFRYYKNHADVRFFYQEEAHLPAAIRFGRQQVDTPFFGFLDDDDIYLPHAVETRRVALEDAHNGRFDVAVTNGWCQTDDSIAPCYHSMREFAVDPLASLIQHNWLTSCGALYRTETIGLDYFDGFSKYIEWTVTAFRLSIDRKIAFVDDFTYRIDRRYSDISLSRSPEYYAGVLSGLKNIAGFELPKHIRKAVLKKYGATLHNVSVNHLRQRNISQAWKRHIESLSQPYGVRYLSYTARLALATLRII